jgi:hypothetical protein
VTSWGRLECYKLLCRGPTCNPGRSTPNGTPCRAPGGRGLGAFGVPVHVQSVRPPIGERRYEVPGVRMGVTATATRSGPRAVSRWT